ncbi:MAG TPA: glycine cleavage system aminomethyltransferase GcvT [Candidatus Kapabacteria bacterium]|nr:glycine cleavage system aminomethyltransferase GcvT [Candidatus Kapabacteria bacterium]
MKRTPFYEKHVALGAKMVEFGGFEMPVQYPKGIIAEHKIVREGGVGVFDVSHMGEFDVTGPDALAFLQHITVNDVSTLAPGKAQYSALPLPNGGIIDDLIIYMLEPDHYMCVVNASTTEKDWAHFSEQAKRFNVTLRNDSNKTALLAIQGAKSIDTLQQLTDVKLLDIPYYNYVRGKLAGIDMILSRTGYTGELGIEIYFTADVATASKVWDAIFEAGKKFGIEPIGLGARDTLRLEQGYCLYGNDIDETTSPLEAGLGWITKLNKSIPCLAADALKAQKEAGLTRKLVGFVIAEKGMIGRHGHPIVNDAGGQIGVVTSGNISPMTGTAIGLGYVPIDHSKEGTEILIEVRPGKRAKGVITKPPFVPPHTK